MYDIQFCGLSSLYRPIVQASLHLGSFNPVSADYSRFEPSPASCYTQLRFEPALKIQPFPVLLSESTPGTDSVCKTHVPQSLGHGSLRLYLPVSPCQRCHNHCLFQRHHQTHSRPSTIFLAFLFHTFRTSSHLHFFCGLFSLSSSSELLCDPFHKGKNYLKFFLVT